MTARKSGPERTKVWALGHESLNMNARMSDERIEVWTWTHMGMTMNAQKSGQEGTKV